MSDFKDRLALAMRCKNISQATLSSITGIPKSAISQYLSGQFSPRPKRLELLSRVLGTTPAWLLAMDDPHPTLDSGDGKYPLTAGEERIIDAYRSDPALRQSIDRLMERSEYGMSVFRAAKSTDGKIPPSYEIMSPKQIKRIVDAPETDDDI